jgi:hypothetical protein
MIRPFKWLIALLASAAAFVSCLWAGWVAGVRLWPDSLTSVADRWAVAAAFATVVAGAVLASCGWWAGREEPGPEREPDSRPVSTQAIRVGAGGSAYVVQHGNQYLYDRPAASTESDPPAAREADQVDEDE